MYSHCDVFGLDVLSLSPTEILEGQNLLGFQVISNRFGIDDKHLGSGFQSLSHYIQYPKRRMFLWTYPHPRYLIYQIRILGTHVF